MNTGIGYNMGSEFSTSNSYASVRLECDSDLCVGDEEFKGMIKVNVKKTFSLKNFLVEIDGKEESTTPENKNSEKIITDYIPLDLPNRQGIVNAGTYMVPFYFKLSKNFPCSFPRYTIEDNQGKIEYICTAKLELNDEKVIGDKMKLRFVHRPITTESIVLHQTKEIKGWFSSDKGISTIEVVIPKSQVYSGEKIAVNINLDNKNCLLKIKRIKCKIYEKTVITGQQSNFEDKPTRTYKVMKCYLPGVEAKKDVSLVETITMPVKREERVLESVSGIYIRRFYVLVLVPVFDIVGGDKMLSVETVLTLSSLGEGSVLHVDGVERNFEKKSQMQKIMPVQPMSMQTIPEQPQPPMIQPPMPMIPQEQNFGQQIPIPPQMMGSAYQADFIAPLYNHVQYDGMNIPVGNPTEWNPNPPIYPAFEPYPPAQAPNDNKGLYPQLE
jgi:hypothetical protein